ncbi:MAG: FG-GAP-like repeat-containing protein [Myxococcota bacterium]
MKLRLGWVFVVLSGALACSGDIRIPLTGDCSSDLECPGGRCQDGRCVGSSTDRDDDDDDDGPTLGQPGDSCEDGFDCENGRCETFGDQQICTQSCSDECPNGLVCFQNRCVPDSFCEATTGQGDGPGCDDSPCLLCDDDAICVASGDTFVCECLAGFVPNGSDCVADECADVDCLNGGICTLNGDTEPRCVCADDDFDGRPDWTGEFCETPLDGCPPLLTDANNPCRNGGDCSNSDEGFVCNCADTGFDGVTCEEDIDECLGAPCLNGGTCSNTEGGFDCVCVAGFIGDECETDARGGCPDSPTSDDNPCENGGVCDDTGGAVTCDCEGTGFTGTSCGEAIDDCDPNPCQQGASCVDLINDYSCNCPQGFGGKDCDEAAPCDDDLEDCASDQFCDTNSQTCQPDTCDPNENRRCEGNTVVQCEPNGSRRTPLFTCVGRPGAFASACQDDGDEDAYCPCEDDWDCPADTVCEVDRCVGTGQPATCSLPAAPFEDVLPTNEITWGGIEQAAGSVDFSLDGAVGSPFPNSSQVVVTPLVANLDDDNGDGLVDERDFPEIVFLTFCANTNAGEGEYRRRGVLRAIHGGGTNKGGDYFAVCGDNVWSEGEPTDSKTCDCGNNNSSDDPDLNPTSTAAIGDLDGDRVPEIVTVVSVRQNGNNRDGRIRIHDNRGTVLFTSGFLPLADLPNGNLSNNRNSSVTLVDLNQSGVPEIVIGNDAFTLAFEELMVIDPDTGLDVPRVVPVIDSHFAGTGLGQTGLAGQGPVSCAADVLGDGDLEIIAGGTIYAMPRPPACAESTGECGGDCVPASAEEEAFCNDELLVLQDLDTSDSSSDTPRDGFCAVGDVLGTVDGADPGRANPLDGIPEVVLISDGRLLIFQRDGNAFRESPEVERSLGLGARGGAPNIDDFDGDGFPEIGTAFAAGYAMMDLQPTTASCPDWPVAVPSTTRWLAPGIEVDAGGSPTGETRNNPARTPPGGSCTSDDDCGGVGSGFACNEALEVCVCEHNGWRRGTQDNSSRVTGSSVFDFNGDGGAEVVYNDECFFRVYEGINGDVRFIESSESRTRIEYPIVADADNDGNAEILFGVSNESGFCASRSNSTTAQSFEPGAPTDYNNGIEVWSDSSDLWVSARRIWNQHAYHVTNVTENASVPRFEPKGWESTNGRFYNLYRSNPRSFGVAPDLEVTAVQVTGDGTSCGAADGRANIVSQITNIGDLRVGPEVAVGFEADWGNGFVTLLDAAGDPLVAVVQNTLEPLDSVFLSVAYEVAFNGESALPNEVRVTVDADYDADAGTIAFNDGRERECDETNNSRTQVVEAVSDLADLVVEQVSVTSCSTLPEINVTIANQGSVAASPIRVRFFAGDPDQGGSSLGDLQIGAALPAETSTTASFTPSSFPQCAAVKVFAVIDPTNAVPECNDGNNSRGQSLTTFCCDGG